jgi:hypothetical protein
MIDTALWLDAADESTFTLVSTKVSQWRDKSGNSRHMAQSTDSSRPVLGSRHVYFNGSNILSTAAAVLTSGLYSIFAVVMGAPQNNKTILAQHTGVGDTNRVAFVSASDTSPYNVLKVFFNNGTSYPIRSTTIAFLTTVPAILCSESNGPLGISCSVNGAGEEGILTGQVLTPLNTPMRMGGVGSVGDFTGYVYEVIIVPYKVPLELKNRINGYLAHKWGLAK